MFLVIQDHQVLWCVADTEENLKIFCQYHVDSALPEGLSAFTIFDTITKMETDFVGYCERNGIRKRSFEERMK